MRFKIMVYQWQSQDSDSAERGLVSYGGREQSRTEQFGCLWLYCQALSKWTTTGLIPDCPPGHHPPAEMAAGRIILSALLT